MKAVFLAAIFFVVFQGSANATLALDPHILTGAIHITNPAGQFKASHTVEYNAEFLTSGRCEDAKLEAESAPVAIAPVANTANFGAFYKVSTLVCVKK